MHKSVKAINQQKRGIGSKPITIKKYTVSSRIVLKKRIKNKLIASGTHGNDIPIHAIPTKTKSLCLYLKYLNKIIIPRIIEITTNMEVKIPCNNSTNSSLMIMYHFFFNNFFLSMNKKDLFYKLISIL